MATPDIFDIEVCPNVGKCYNGTCLVCALSALASFTAILAALVHYF